MDSTSKLHASPENQSSTPTPEELTEVAVQFVLAMMASASTKRISPMDWWERARTALEFSTRTARDHRHMVTLFARKISAETLTASTSDRLASCLCSIETPHAFAAFRRAVARESTYIVAFAQMRRAEQREEEGAIREAAKPVEARLAASQEQIRALTIERDMWKTRAADEAANNLVLKASITKRGSE